MSNSGKLDYQIKKAPALQNWCLTIKLVNGICYFLIKITLP